MGIARSPRSRATSPASARADAADASEQLEYARDLLTQGRTGDAQQVIGDVGRSCDMLARSLAGRGDRIRAGMLAGLAVELARIAGRDVRSDW